MPIAPKFILGSRMLLLLALDLGYVLLVMAPAGVVYCMNYSVTALGVVYFIISTLLLPLMVQAFSCLIAWIVSLISSKMRNKNIITMVASLVFLAAYFYLYSKMGDIISGLIANGTAVAVAFKKYAFPAYYFGVGIAEHNPTYLLLFTVCTLVVFELVYAVLSRSFRQITTVKKGVARIEYKEKSIGGPAARLLRCSARISGILSVIPCIEDIHGITDKMPEILAEQRSRRAAGPHGFFLILDACNTLFDCGDLPEATGKNGIDQLEHHQRAYGKQQ